jgi:hypothetical protein
MLNQARIGHSRDVSKEPSVRLRSAPLPQNDHLRYGSFQRKAAQASRLFPLRIVGHVPARGKEVWRGHCFIR